MNMSTKTALFLLLSTALGVAETPRQFNAWSVYPASGNQSVLLQVTSQPVDNNVQGVEVQAKLDVVCRKGKVSAVAVETNLPIEKGSMSYVGAVPTTRIAFRSEDRQIQSETWAVLNGGHTISPYSEAFQGRLTRAWIKRLADSQTIAIHLGSTTQGAVQPSFDTRELYEALSSVGCSY
jgi:hypothetical protein